MGCGHVRAAKNDAHGYWRDGNRLFTVESDILDYASLSGFPDLSCLRIELRNFSASSGGNS